MAAALGHEHAEVVSQAGTQKGCQAALNSRSAPVRQRTARTSKLRKVDLVLHSRTRRAL